MRPSKTRPTWEHAPAESHNLPPEDTQVLCHRQRCFDLKQRTPRVTGELLEFTGGSPPTSFDDITGHGRERRTFGASAFANGLARQEVLGVTMVTKPQLGGPMGITE